MRLLEKPHGASPVDQHYTLRAVLAHGGRHAEHGRGWASLLETEPFLARTKPGVVPVTASCLSGSPTVQRQREQQL